ncbi:MAG: hypothetical protein HY585_01070 [Candidatus Omnitrophica bacterium]|nr:hypothetical protein [Candidatus Omnitrophota bacterium]
MKLDWKSQRTHRERGAVLILTAVSMIAFLSFFALVVDLGYIFVTKSELQNTADSAALAAILEIQNGEELAAQKAVDFGQAHQVAGSRISIAAEDIVFGHYDLALSQFIPAELPLNAVQVTARRTDDALSGPLPLIFAKLFGNDTSNVQAMSRAVLDTRITGVDTGNKLLPYSVINSVVDADGDGAFDVGNIVDVFPDSAAPGNFGFLDLDGGSNGTPDLRDWIEEGYDSEFIIPPGGSLEIPGNPGIHGASLLNSFQTIIDQVRFIPIHDHVSGSGNGAIYNVVAILAVRVRDVRLTGSQSNRYINLEIISFSSSDLQIDPDAPENNGLSVPRLAI